MNCLR